MYPQTKNGHFSRHGIIFNNLMHVQQRLIHNSNYVQ
jgi:hypothetical protein